MYRPPEAQGSSPRRPHACTERACRTRISRGGAVRYVPLPPPHHGTTGLDKHLFLSPETFLSLGIFADRLHPSAHGGRAREGQFSVWATMNKTRSRPGARMLRGWFAQPSQDAELLRVTAC